MDRPGSTRTTVVALLAGLLFVPAGAGAQLAAELANAYVWPSTVGEGSAAEAAIENDPTLVGVSRSAIERLSQILRRKHDAPPNRMFDLGPDVLGVEVSVPGGRRVITLVRLPSSYTPARQWPLMFAMHGGPPSTADGAVRGARSMIDVWAAAAEQAGWIVAAPIMADVVARGGRTAQRLPYEIFHPEEARAVLDSLRSTINIDPDRIVSTGISLGSNFSIAYAAAHPDWFSAIVPVSTEGESREYLLRNLAPVPTYVLEGSQDENIRDLSGPRALKSIMNAFDYDLVYREFSDRAHEGFQEHYPEVLEWLTSRPRDAAPTEVLRVPHSGIVSVGRRIHWVETDTRQAFVHASVVSETQIDVATRWAGTVTLYLNDDLVDLDHPITVHVNGLLAHRGPLERSVRFALDDVRSTLDEGRLYAARLELTVPVEPAAVARAVEAWDELTPKRPKETLSFWETYAIRSIEERFPSVGFDGREEELPDAISYAPEQVGLRVGRVEPGGPAAAAGLRQGDLLVSVGGEPFFRNLGGSGGLHDWLVRELRSTEVEYDLVVWRHDRLQTLKASYALGPYRPPDT